MALPSGAGDTCPEFTVAASRCCRRGFMVCLKLVPDFQRTRWGGGKGVAPRIAMIMSFITGIQVATLTVP